MWIWKVPGVAAVVAALLMAGCSDGGGRQAGAAAPRVLAVAAASDLRFALDEVIERFEQDRPATAVEVTYGSSGNFFAQISNGAPFDLFLSADVTYPEQLIERGVAVPDSLFLYAEGRLALWVPAASPLEIERRGLHALLDAAGRVAIANPEHAPYGRAAEAALRSAGLLESVRPKIVLGDNIAQTLQFVQSGSAAVGLVALSLARAPAVAGQGRYVVVPREAHPPLEQGGAILKAADDPEAAHAFGTFMQSHVARNILAAYGFEAPRRAARLRTPRSGTEP